MVCLLASSYPAHADDVAGTFVPHVVRGLEQRGHRVVVLTQAKPGPWDAGGLDVRWFRWRGAAPDGPAARARALVHLRPWWPPDALDLVSWLTGARAAVMELVQRERPDICLALMALPAGLVAWAARRNAGLPYVVWALGSDVAVWGQRPVARSLVGAVLRGAAMSFADGVRLADQASSIAGRPTAFLPTVRPLPAVVGDPALSAQHRHVVFVGRLERVKGPDLALSAWARVHRARPDAMLHVVGDGALEPALRTMSARLGLDGVVAWHGRADGAGVAGYLARADAVVIPSRSESIPLVLSEALQMGAPLAVTDVGDMGSLVRGHGLGLVARPEDVASLARALGGVLAAGREAYAQRLATARRMFDYDSVLDRLEAALVAAAGGGHA